MNNNKPETKTKHLENNTKLVTALSSNFSAAHYYFLIKKAKKAFEGEEGKGWEKQAILASINWTAFRISSQQSVDTMDICHALGWTQCVGQNNGQSCIIS